VSRQGRTGWGEIGLTMVRPGMSDIKAVQFSTSYDLVPNGYMHRADTHTHTHTHTQRQASALAVVEPLLKQATCLRASAHL
jgi:hypothetical protein